MSIITERAGTPGGLARAAGRAVRRFCSSLAAAPLPASSPPGTEAERTLRTVSGRFPPWNYAGADATAEAPAASWEEWQRWAARAPHGQRRERQQTLVQYTAEMLRQEVGR